MSAPRSYPVPKAIRDQFWGETTTLDEMEMVACRRNDAGDWCKRVLHRENEKTLTDLLGERAQLPWGVVVASAFEKGDEIVTALVNSDGKVFRGDSWTEPENPIPQEEVILLSSADVAYIARAFKEGAEAVLLSHIAPLAFLTAAVATSGEDGSALPVAGSVPVAIVDALHQDAILELLAVAPGPVVYRRHAGQWFEDPGWVAVLASVNPPTMVKLDENQVASVAKQIDAATTGEFQPLLAEDNSLYRPIRAAAHQTAREIQDKTLDRIINLNLGLLAVGGRELSPKDYASTEKLRRYWLYGAGAAKIRWFTPGAWRRCYRHLVKYLGPKMTPGYCTNLSQRLGGQGVATHVGD